MTQSVTVGRDNVVRVFEAGPIGPPGFSGGGKSGPVELLPLPISRQTPWSGWVQFDGFPVGTNSWFGIRSAMLWAAVPAMTMILDDGGSSPLFISDGDTHNLSITVLGTNYNTGVFPEGSQVRVTAFLVSLNGVPIPEGEETLVLLQDDLYTPPPGSIPDKDALLELFEAGTTKTTFSIPEGYAILFLTIDVLDATGERFSPETLPNGDTLLLNKLSIWKGDPDEDPVVDINDGYAFLGMQVQTNVVTRYLPFGGSPFRQTGGTYLTMTARGLDAEYQKYADGVINTNVNARLHIEPDDGEVSGIHWEMNNQTHNPQQAQAPFSERTENYKSK